LEATEPLLQELLEEARDELEELRASSKKEIEELREAAISVEKRESSNGKVSDGVTPNAG